jgi:hypothetical protein
MIGFLFTEMVIRYIETNFGNQTQISSSSEIYLMLWKYWLHLKQFLNQYYKLYCQVWGV